MENVEKCVIEGIHLMTLDKQTQSFHMALLCIHTKGGLQSCVAFLLHGGYLR